MPDAPRVVISYSHDSDEHETRVLDLANRLRDEGIDAEIDQYETAPDQGWPFWCERKIKQAGFVLLVCTETYLRRIENEEEAGCGLGVVWEARIIRQLIYNAGARTKKFVPVLFGGGLPEHIPTPVQGATRWQVDKAGDYEGLYRQLTNQPKAVKPALGKIRPMPPKETRSGPAAKVVEPVTSPLSPPRPAGGGAPHPRAGEVFVGRAPQLAVLAACLLPDDAAKRKPVAVMGMAGVGKSYLVDRFFLENQARFPGGYHRLALDAEKLGTAAELLAVLADRLKLPAAVEDEAVAAALAAPLALVHVENVDTDEAAATVGDLVARLPGCAIVLSARMSTLAAGTGWGEAKLSAFDETDALQQFAQELRGAVPDDGALRPIIGALGGLPLALHLAAGHLQAGETPQGFLQLLRRQGLSLAPISKADPSFRERSHTRLEAIFALSLAALGRAAEACGRPAQSWSAAFHALGYGPAAGFGESLGAAIADLDEDEFADLARTACAMSLLDRVPRDGATAFRLHPLLAELGRRQAPQEAVIGRTTDWFCERLPEPAAGEAGRWNEVHAETAALLDWLPQVPEAKRLDVSFIAIHYAVRNGPFREWIRFYQDLLSNDLTDNVRSYELWALSSVALHGGLLDLSLELAQAKLELDRTLSNYNGTAAAADIIAQVLRYRGDFAGALHIRLNEQIPAHKNLGDERAISIIYRAIADLYIERSDPPSEDDLREAFRLLNDESVPRAQRLGKVRDVAVFRCRIAVVLYRQRKFEEALNIFYHEVLPIHKQFGEQRSVAVTKGLIADALAASGKLDEAIRIRKEEVLPVLQRIEERRGLTLGRLWQASDLLQRGEAGDRENAQELLCLALADARRLRIPQAGRIEAILQEHGLSCD